MLGTISSEVTCCHRLSCLGSKLLVLFPSPFFPVSLFLSLPVLLRWTYVGYGSRTPWPALGLCPSLKLASAGRAGSGVLNYVSQQVGSGHRALGTVISFYEIMFSFGCYGRAKCSYFVSGAFLNYPVVVG